MATYTQIAGKTIDAAFEEFHQANPHIYDRFKKLAFLLIKKGKKRYSSKTIICVIRFQQDIQTDSFDEFKINDIFTSRYARLFIEDFPQHQNFFELRELRG